MCPGTSDRLVLLAIVLTGCVHPDLVVCGDGRACPGGTVCDVPHATCVDRDRVTACAGAADGADCEAGSLSGVCDRGVCIEDVPPVIAPFQAAVPLAGFASVGAEEDDPSLTGDMLELFFLRSGDIWWSRRTAVDQPWAIPGQVPELMTGDTEFRPAVSADGLTLYFARRPGGGKADVYVTTRASRTAPWAAPVRLALDLNRAATEEAPGWSSPDGLTLFVTTATAAGDDDLYIATRPALDQPFTSVPFTALDSPQDDSAAWATPDGATIVFTSDRNGNNDLWEAVRHRDGWVIERHAELSTLDPEGTPWLSPDGTVIVFSTTRGGTDDLYIATRPP